MIARRRVVIGLASSLVVEPRLFAQQPRKLWRIGLLYLPSKKFFIDSGYQDSQLLGMREHGYELGRDFVFEERFANGDSARLPTLAIELVRAKVDLILTNGTQANRAALEATTTIPIVTAAEADPVGNGFAVSLARPGKNMTGLATLLTETIVKNFELLTAVLPKQARVAVLKNPSNPGLNAQLANIQAAAQKLGVRILPIDAGNPEEIERAIAGMQREGVHAFMTLPDSFFSQQTRQIAQLALKHRLPSTFFRASYAEAGGLMSHGQDFVANWRLSAKFIDQIFKGAKAGDLPFEQPIAFEMEINLKTARELGITVPQILRIQATRVID